MCNKQRRIEELKYKIAMINMQSHLDEDDYELMKQMQREIDELEAELPKTYWIVLFKNGYYLSSSATLCFSETPCRFRSKREAMSYLDRAYMDDDDKASASVMRIKE